MVSCIILLVGLVSLMVSGPELCFPPHRRMIHDVLFTSKRTRVLANHYYLLGATTVLARCAS
jgi:hypothetical protein